MTEINTGKQWERARKSKAEDRQESTSADYRASNFSLRSANAIIHINDDGKMVLSET